MSDKTAFPSDTADKVLVRMPDGMRDQLKEAAKTNNRTMNAEIVARLEQSFAGGTSDEALKSLAIRLAETEFNLRFSEVESTSHLLDAHYAAGAMIEAVGFNKAMGFDQPIEDEALKEIKKIFRDTQEFIDDQTPDNFSAAITEMQAAHERLKALKPRTAAKPRSARKARTPPLE